MELTSQQIISLRGHLELSQEEFGEKIGVSGSTIGAWENENSTPRKANMEAMVKLYKKHLPASNGKSNGSASSGYEVKQHASKGGKHKVSVARTQSVLSKLDEHLLEQQTEMAAKFVASEYELEFTTFREAVVVFLYGMEDMPAKKIAQVLSGHE